MTCIRIPNGIVTLADEVEPKRGRTPRETVLAQIREFGGFTVFWATEFQNRAKAIERLEAEGLIVRQPKDPKDRFPWCVYIIAEPTP